MTFIAKSFPDVPFLQASFEFPEKSKVEMVNSSASWVKICRRILHQMLLHHGRLFV
jgi:hypothetical protein